MPSSDKALLSDAPSEKTVVRTFGAASFLNDMGSDIVFSIWPIFVGLLSPPGLTPLILGIIDGTGDLVVNILKGISGIWSDRIQKRKPFIWSGYMMGATSRIVYAFSPTWQWLIPAKILDRAGKVRGAPRDAIVADVSTHETRGKNFGLLRTADHTGATAGILITIAFVTFVFPWLTLVYGFDLLMNIRLLFLLAAIPTFIGALVIIYRIVDYRKEPGKAVFHISGINRSLAIFIIPPAINPILGVPVAYLVFTLAAALTSAPLGRLGDRIGRRRTILIGFLFFGGMCALFLFTPNFWTVLFALIFYGISIGATVPMQSALISELSPLKIRSSVLGFYQMLIGFALLPASVIAGFLWVFLGPSYTFGLALFLTVIAAILLPFIHEPKTSD